MISICIPIYNVDVRALIHELAEQASALSLPYELILIDDCSQPTFKALNRTIAEQYHYIELKENIGRARIRNLFVKYARFEYLLFLDCDANITTSDFLAKYVTSIDSKPMVVCGGRIYPTQRPPRSQQLRWRYGIVKESQPVEVRRQFPNKSFMTNNFLIHKSIFQQVSFDEQLKGYGHEDTLFGYALKKAGITITHINNPVVNGDWETNAEYLRKTKEGILNLVNLMRMGKINQEMKEDISLLKFYERIRPFRSIIRVLFVLSKPALTYMLRQGVASLYLFDFYKLGTLIEEDKK